ncbi:hypothetical protein R75461_05904 [Paraburkholderia nemoris]|nr:hypothetical protein R75461_05904 [Paraburkholderia nemoris]
MQIVIPSANAPDEHFEAVLPQCGGPIGSGTTRDAYAIRKRLGWAVSSRARE